MTFASKFSSRLWIPQFLTKAVIVLLSTIAVAPQLVAQVRNETNRDAIENQIPLERLVGVWEAEQLFVKDNEELIVVENQQGTWSAKIGDVVIRHHGNNEKKILFSMPDETGSFRGQFDRETNELSGHWIQPPTENINYPLATPLQFSRQGNGWAAKFKRCQDRLRLYLCVTRPEGKPLEAFIRNPERNLGIRIGYLHVERDGDQIRLRQIRGDAVFEGQWVEKHDAPAIVMKLPWSTRPFEFVLIEKTADSDFFPTKIETSYRYTDPESINDGWACCSAVEQGLDTKRLEALVQSIHDTKTDSLSTPYIHSILIARQGNLVLEEYFYGYQQGEPHDTRSAGKSISSMLVGAVMDKNTRLNESRTIASIFGDTWKEPFTKQQPDYALRSSWRNQITIGHALSMQSGLDADDNNYDSLGNEDRMQDQSEISDWVAYLHTVPMVRQPGQLAVYGSNSVNLAASAIARETGEWLPDLFYKYLAAPLDFRNYHFNLDPIGQGYMGGGIRLTPRDQLKLGQVMLNDGKWQGREILSEQWVKKSIQAHGSIHEPNDYGYSWWRKSLTLNDNRTVEIFHAGGNGGQLIVCIPEFELVVQMSGGNYGNFPVWYRNLTELIPQQVLAAVKETSRSK